MIPFWLINKYSDSPDLTEFINTFKKIYPKDSFDIVENSINWNNYKNKPVISYGCINFIKNAQKELAALNCAPIAYCYFPAYNCDFYYPYVEKYLFNNDWKLTTLETFKIHKFDYFRELGKECKIFCRPNTGDKLFTGQLIDLEEFDKFWEKHQIGNQIIILSSPKEINGEFRFICAPNEIIAESTYLYQGMRCQIPTTPIKARKLCQEIISQKWINLFDPVFSVDICEDKSGNCHLLEFNSFSSCGLYACNKEKIIKRVSEIACEKYKK